MCELYQSSKSNVIEHIKHIFEEGELNEESYLVSHPFMDIPLPN